MIQSIELGDLLQTIEANQPYATLVLDPSGNTVQFCKYKASLADADNGPHVLTPDSIKTLVREAIKREFIFAIHLTPGHTLQDLLRPDSLPASFLVKTQVTDEEMEIYIEGSSDAYITLDNFKLVVIVSSSEVPDWATDLIGQGRLVPIRIV